MMNPTLNAIAMSCASRLRLPGSYMISPLAGPAGVEPAPSGLEADVLP